ncbi:hypothetical protein K1719_046886 [Acacia pycnantha]|nr:hypothetical protein K1719_046886 [Acacia pycnantha]
MVQSQINSPTSRNHEGDGRWASLFGLTCWKLWEARNKAIFQDVHTHPTALAREVRVFSEFGEQAKNRQVKQSAGSGQRVKEISWCKPQPGMVALNCDGALKRDPLAAGAGSVLRDHEGKWLGGEMVNDNMGLVRRINQLRAQDWRVNLTHVYREGNYCADVLATHALKLNIGLHTLEDPPDGLMTILHEDAVGVTRPRWCSCTD